MNLAAIVSRNLNLAWDLLGDDVIRGVVFKKITGYTLNGGVHETNIDSAACNAISISYSSRDIDGQSIVTGDEKWLVRGSELEDITPIPDAGDWFEESGIRWEIQAANRDATRTLWTFHVRRQLVEITDTVGGIEDWGFINYGNPVTVETEDWGGLALFDSSEDWMS